MTEFISGALGAIIGALSSFLILRYNYKDLYARSVSTNRMDWINNFREEIGAIVAGLRYKKRVNRENKTDDVIYQAEKARAKLLTRLNQDTSKPGNEFNEVMTDLLNSLDFNSYNISRKEEYAKLLIKLSRDILEPEWQRVKREARGKE